MREGGVTLATAFIIMHIDIVRLSIVDARTINATKARPTALWDAAARTWWSRLTCVCLVARTHWYFVRMSDGG